MNAKENIWKKQVALNNTAVALVKCFVTVWAFSYMNSRDDLMTDTFLDFPNGWGIKAFFIFLGVGAVYYLVRDRQKSPWVSGLGAFFAISTVIGISYSKTGTWDYVFGDVLSFAVAFLAMLGYYFAYKNGILFTAWLFEKKPDLLRREPVKKIEIFLFEKHPFGGQLLFLFLAALPWLVFFCPGTLQWDGHSQLWIFFGAPEAEGYAGESPVILTQIMGGCIWLGRQLFHSDSVGLFFYNILQYAAQLLVFAYAGFVLRKLKAPVLFSWAALLYWGVYPLFPIWGYTMVKDTPFYIFILLHIVSLMDIMVCSQKTKVTGWQFGLFLVSIAGVCLSRNDGQYVILITLFSALLFYRRYWKICTAGIAACLLLVFAVNGIYKPLHHIAGTNTGDILSIPLQQTGRYLRLHSDEVTGEEAEILQGIFEVPLGEVAQEYNPLCVDPVKWFLRTDLDSDDVGAYLKVWFRQFLKHPDTYIQAFLHHNHMYFYPDGHDYLHGYLEVTAIFYLVDEEQRYKDEYLDIRFAIPDRSGRGMLEDYFYTVEKMPLFGMLKSAGLHVYLLLGECLYLLAKKRRKEMLFLIPGLFVFLLRLFSPVACVRYVLPIMVMLPVTAAWCYLAAHKKEIN